MTFAEFNRLAGKRFGKCQEVYTCEVDDDDETTFVAFIVDRFKNFKDDPTTLWADGKPVKAAKRAVWVHKPSSPGFYWDIFKAYRGSDRYWVQLWRSDIELGRLKGKVVAKQNYFKSDDDREGDGDEPDEIRAIRLERL